MYHDHANYAQIGANGMFANVERNDGFLLKLINDLHHSLFGVYNLVWRVFQRLHRQNRGWHLVLVFGIRDVYASRKKWDETVNFIGVWVQIAMNDIILQIHTDLAGIIGQQKHARQSIISYD